MVALEEKSAINKVIWIHPLGIMNVCTKAGLNHILGVEVFCWIYKILLKI